MDKQTQETVFSSKSAEWETPQDFFNKLDAAWAFTLDPCCTTSSAKCKKHFTINDDGLSKDWSGNRVFMNPPYGRSIGKWIKKAYEEGQKPNTVVVCLLPARTCTKWFHEHCMKSQAIYFVKGRLKFENKVVVPQKGKAISTAPFPSMVVVFNGTTPTWNSGFPRIVETMERS